MKKLYLLTKTLLLAVGFIMGGVNFAWGQKYQVSTTSGTFTGEQVLLSEGLVKLTLASSSDTWTAANGNQGSYGITAGAASLTDNIPTSGTFVKIEPYRDLYFVLQTWSYNNMNYYLIESTNPASKTQFRARYNDARNLGRLTAGKTYYVYTDEASILNGIKGFIATSYENYTIHYVDNSVTPVTIKSDVVLEGLYGESASASGSDLDPIVYNAVNYVYDSGNTPITLSTSGNEITLVYTPGSQYDYTINAVAGGVTIKELATGSVASGANYGTKLSKVIYTGGNHYVLIDAGVSNYYAEFTMGDDDEVQEVEYTLDNSIVYYLEGSNLGGENTAYSNGDLGQIDSQNKRCRGVSVGALTAGIYEMESYFTDRGGFGLALRDKYIAAGTEDANIVYQLTGSNNTTLTGAFLIENDLATSCINSGNQGDDKTSLSAAFDYVIIRKLGDIVAEGTYYLKNKVTGAYFAAGLNYGTKAITNTIGHAFTLSKQANGYYIDTQIANSETNHYLNGEWTDGAASIWNFHSDGAGYYSVDNGSGNLTAGAIGEALSIVAGTTDNAKWQLLTEEAWKAENVARLDAATASNGVDATFYIPASNFNRNDNTENGKWQGSPAIGGLSENSASTNFNGEKFNTTFDVYQALTGLKPGAYKLTAQGYYRNGLDNVSNANDHLAMLYANDVTEPLVNINVNGFTDDSYSAQGFTTAKSGYYIPDTQTDASKAFNAGYYNNELFVVVGEDGDLRVGVKKTVAVDKDWTVFDNFQLTYYGENVSATIGSTGWTTFASAYPLDLSNMSVSTGDVTAYYASSVGGDYVRMTSTEQNGVAAGEGIMLKGTASATITIPVVASGTAIAGNLLKGCTTSTALAADATSGYNNYVLVNNNGTAEFQSLVVNGATIPAGKAYLQNGAYSAGAKALSIVFEETTSIHNSQFTIDNDVWYDLNGCRLNKKPATKGIFIKNGKKVVK